MSPARSRTQALPTSATLTDFEYVHGLPGAGGESVCLCRLFFYLWGPPRAAQGRGSDRPALIPLRRHQVRERTLRRGLFRLYGLETIGLRYFNIYGRRQDPLGAYAAVIPQWIGALLQGKQPIINGDGSTSRDFCYVDNAVQANLRAALIDETEALNTVYNIACQRQTSLNDLLRIIQSPAGRERSPRSPVSNPSTAPSARGMCSTPWPISPRPAEAAGLRAGLPHRGRPERNHVLVLVAAKEAVGRVRRTRRPLGRGKMGDGRGKQKGL